MKNENEAIDQANTIEKKSVSPILRVKSKTGIKGLSGSIINTMKDHGFATLRAIGDGAIGRATRGATLARKNLSVADVNMIMVTSFFDTEIDGNEKTGIQFRIEDEVVKQPENIEEGAILKVRSDTIPKELSSSIVIVFKKYGYAVLRSIGDGATSRAIKGATISRGPLALSDAEIVLVPSYFMPESENSDLRPGCQIKVVKR